MEDEHNKPNILEMIAQLASLQKILRPALPAVSKKLVSDLLDTGANDRRIAKAIGRGPGFVRRVAAGESSLTAQQIVDLLKHATVGQGNGTN